MSLLKKIWTKSARRSRKDPLSRLVNMSQAMQQAIDISGNHVMCLDLQQNKVNDLCGKAKFGANTSIEKCYSYIHPDDRPTFQHFIERLSQGIVKEDECRYRWNQNYTGHGDAEWHNMHCYAIAEYADHQDRPVNIIATLTDETQTLQKQREAQQLSEKYQLIFEDSIIGLSFYSPDGWLLASNRIMREICHFDSESGDEFFSKANLFDQAPFSEILDRNNIEEFWCCSLSVVPERDMHVYLEIRLRPIYDADGKLNCLSVAVRDINEERELYYQAKQNETDLQAVNESIQLYEKELRYMLEACDMRVWKATFNDHKIRFYRGLSTVEREITFDELIDGLSTENDYYQQFREHPEDFFVKSSSVLLHTRSIFHEANTMQWDRINSIPVYDEQGKLTGAFGLIRNMTDIMEKQEQLKRETQRANESGKQKSVFLANMTHEIRTPLNAIVGFADVLPMLTTDDEKQEVVRVIMNNCDMLLRLVNDMLEASDMGESLVIEPEQVDLVEFFNDVFLTLVPRVNNPAITFQKDNPYDVYVTSIDKGRLMQLLTNFVTNAVKYTQEGHIRLGWHEEKRQPHGGEEQKGLYFYCEDTGIGIPKEQQQSVFERFVKLNDFVQGSGLGLSNCKAIIDKWGGDIGVQSEGEGHGSTFWFWIPCKEGQI